MSKNEIQDLKQKFEKIFNSFIHLLKLYVNSIVAFKYESGLCTNIIIGIDSYTNFCINISSEEIHFYFYKYIDTFYYSSKRNNSEMYEFNKIYTDPYIIRHLYANKDETHRVIK